MLFGRVDLLDDPPGIILMPNWNLSSPNPIASALSAVVLLIYAAAIVSLLSYLRCRSTSKTDKGDITLNSNTADLRAEDGFVVCCTSWVAGTLYRSRLSVFR